MVGGNSDSPVSEMNPLLGFYATVNASFKSQRIRLREAMELFTINGAKIAHKEDQLGSIEVGKHADLVVLKQNPFERKYAIVRA